MVTSANKGDSDSLLAFYDACLEVFTKTGITIDAPEFEKRVFRLHEILSSPSREFHRVARVLGLIQKLEPVAALAALYRGAANSEVDGAINPTLLFRISQIVTDDKGRLTAKAPASQRVQLLYDVFGIVADENLEGRTGIDEFLSAALAAVEVGPHLSEFQYASLICSIEATIPFDGTAIRSQTRTDAAARLSQASQKLALGLAPPHIDAIIASSVRFGNADVAHFAAADPAIFLDETWKLIPERDPAMRKMGAYTLSRYRCSLQALEAFLAKLTPANVFQRYKDCPNDREWAELVSRSEKTLNIAVRYIQAKLVAISILEGLAELTGGDAPVIYFAGPPKHDRDTSAPQLLDRLPDPKTIRATPFKSPTESVLHLLSRGRLAKSGFDSRKSPIAAYVYAALGDTVMQEAVAKSKQVFTGELSWADYLAWYPKPLVTLLARAATNFAKGRERALMVLAEKLSR